MKEERDIFDLFKEESENLNEVPSSEAWNRLEKRLNTSRRRKQVRRPVQLQLIAIIVTVALLLLIGVLSWITTKQHEDILRGQAQFAQLRFLNGKWSFSDKKTRDVLDLNLIGDFQMSGDKSLYFEEDLISKTPLSIKNEGKNNLFIFENNTYQLDDITNSTFTFKSSKGQSIRLRKSTDDRFTISFGEGIIFIFKRQN